MSYLQQQGFTSVTNSSSFMVVVLFESQLILVRLPPFSCLIPTFSKFIYSSSTGLEQSFEG